MCSVTAAFANVCKIVLQMVTEHSEERCEGPMQLSDEEEEDLCRVWDMAMDKVDFLFCVPKTTHCLFSLLKENSFI